MEIQDNWEQQLNCDGPFERWTGWSVFQIKDFPTPRDFPWDLGAEQQGEDEEGGGADERGNPRPEGSNGNQEGGASAASDGDRERGSGAEGDRAAGGSRWTSFEAEGIDKIAEEAAFKYIETIDGIEDQEDTNGERCVRQVINCCHQRDRLKKRRWHSGLPGKDLAGTIFRALTTRTWRACYTQIT